MNNSNKKNNMKILKYKINKINKNRFSRMKLQNNKVINNYIINIIKKIIFKNTKINLKKNLHFSIKTRYKNLREIKKIYLIH